MIRLSRCATANAGTIAVAAVRPNAEEKPGRWGSAGLRRGNAGPPSGVKQYAGSHLEAFDAAE
jgi:hypothetical protein